MQSHWTSRMQSELHLTSCQNLSFGLTSSSSSIASTYLQPIIHSQPTPIIRTCGSHLGFGWSLIHSRISTCPPHHHHTYICAFPAAVDAAAHFLVVASSQVLVLAAAAVCSLGTHTATPTLEASATPMCAYPNRDRGR